MGREGVPTQTSERSVAATASAADPVARRRPSRTAAANRSPIPSSMIGDSPRPTIATFNGFTSTPTTSWPSAARQAAVVVPT